MHNVTNAFVIYDIIKAEEVSNTIKSIHLQIYGADMTAHFKIMLFVMCALNLLAILFLVNLIVFHIELKYRGLTTYEFLKMQENKSMKSKIVLEITAEMRAELEQEQLDRIRLGREQAELRKKIEMVALKNREESGQDMNENYKKKKSYHYHLSRVCSRDSPSHGSNGVHAAGPPTSRGSLIINEQNTALSEEKKYEDYSFPTGRPGALHIISKLFPCFSCCQKRNAQIVQETSKCANYSGNFEYDNKQVIENKLENLGDLSGSKSKRRRLDLENEGVGGNETDEYIFHS